MPNLLPERRGRGQAGRPPAAAGSRNTHVALRRTRSIGSSGSPDIQRTTMSALELPDGEYESGPRRVDDTRRQRHASVAVELIDHLTLASAVDDGIVRRPRCGVPIVAEAQVDDIESWRKRRRVATRSGAQIGHGDRHQPNAHRECRRAGRHCARHRRQEQRARRPATRSCDPRERRGTPAHRRARGRSSRRSPRSRRPLVDGPHRVVDPPSIRRRHSPVRR